VSVDSVVSRLNPLVCWLLRSPLHFVASPGLLLLTLTGRRSGRRHSFPVGYQRDGEVLTVMVSEAPSKQWWQNLREPAPVEVVLRGRAHGGRAELVPAGSDLFFRCAEDTLRRVPGMDRVFGIRWDRRAALSPEQRERLSGNVAVVRIQLTHALDAAVTPSGR